MDEKCTKNCACLFQNFYLKSSAERAEKFKVKFACFAVVVIFGVLGLATKICYSMLYFRDKGKYSFLWELLFWRMDCIIILITCWLIKTYSLNGQMIILSVLCKELKSFTINADSRLNQFSLEKHRLQVEASQYSALPLLPRASFGNGTTWYWCHVRRQNQVIACRRADEESQWGLPGIFDLMSGIATILHNLISIRCCKFTDRVARCSRKKFDIALALASAAIRVL